MSRRVPRLADLYALRSFGSEFREDQAVTPEQFLRPRRPRRPLVAAMVCWLGLRRRTWFEMEGRRISGIATAQSMGTRHAWQIDSLTYTRSAMQAGEAGVAPRLLQQVAVAAVAARVGHVLLRTSADGAAVGAALRAGFLHASTERLWTGTAIRAPGGREPEAVIVRDVRAEDVPELFRLYNAATPLDARRALALTLAEWRALGGNRWVGRHGRRWVAVVRGRVVAAAQVNSEQARGQLELLCEPTVADVRPDPGAPGRAGCAALLARVADVTARHERIVALVPRSAPTIEGLLRECGLEPGRELHLLALRTKRLATDPARRRAGVVVASGG